MLADVARAINGAKEEYAQRRAQPPAHGRHASAIGFRRAHERKQQAHRRAVSHRMPCSIAAAPKSASPTQIYQLDRLSVAAILRGLFTAEGSIGSNQPGKAQYVALDVLVERTARAGAAPSSLVRHQINSTDRARPNECPTALRRISRRADASFASRALARVSSAKSASTPPRPRLARLPIFSRPSNARTGSRWPTASQRSNRPARSRSTISPSPTRITSSPTASSCTIARSTCSWMTPRAILPASTWSSSSNEDGELRRATLRGSLPHLDVRRSRSASLMAQFPSKIIAQKILRLPHARPRLCEPRHAAHAHGLAVRFRRRLRLVRRDHRAA